jgi:ribosomal protein S18 acetylase RimI-like enzyme
MYWRMGMRVRTGKMEDIEGIRALYKNVAYDGSGLHLLKEEVTTEYVENFVRDALDSGIIVVVEVGDRIIGELHGIRRDFKLYGHVIRGINIAVLREYRGMGIGKSLFKYFFKKVNNREEILRLEVVARESNPRAINFYEKVGFIIEGRLKDRIKNYKGELEADLILGWVKKK